MVEQLGPNMARSLMGSSYNPACRYELETDDDGFHLIITNTEDGTSTYMDLQPEPPDPEKIKPLWSSGVRDDLPKNSLLCKLLFWCCIIAGCACIALILFL